MTLESPLVLLALGLVLLVVLYLVHNHLLTSAVAAAKAEFTKVETAVRADLPDVEADAMAALSRGMTWLTDTSSELATKAKADASIAKKNALAAQAAAALAARAAPATPPVV